MNKRYLILIISAIAAKCYGQEVSDTLSLAKDSILVEVSDTLSLVNNSVPVDGQAVSSMEIPKTYELRGSLRGLAKVFSESPNGIDLLETRLKLELVSPPGKKTAFHALGYAVYQNPQNQLTFNLQEAYVDYYTKYIDFRFGQQTNAWGKADELNPTDVLNPQDLSNITEDKGIRKIGLFQTKADIKLYDFVLTAIWKPVFEYMQVPDLDSRWAFFSIPNVTTLPTPIYPENKFKNTEWALKLARTISSVDVSLSYFDGWDNIFTPKMAVDTTTHKPYLKELVTNRTKMFGADFATSIASVGFWGEGAYFLTEDKDGVDPLSKNPYFQVVVGADYQFNNNYKLNIQYFQEFVTKTDNDLEKTTEEKMMSKLGIGLPLKQALTCRFEKKFGQAEEYKLELFGIYDLKYNGILFTPKFFYSPEDGFNIELGYNLFAGDEDSFWTQFQHNDEVYLKCTYSF